MRSLSCYLDCSFWLGKGEVAVLIGRENGAPDRIRTCDQRLRKPLLYPAELRVLETDFLNETIMCWSFSQCFALPLLPSPGSGPASQQVGWRSAARETCFAKRLPHPAELRVLETNFLNKTMETDSFQKVGDFTCLGGLSPWPIWLRRYFPVIRPGLAASGSG